MESEGHANARVAGGVVVGVTVVVDVAEVRGVRPVSGSLPPVAPRTPTSIYSALPLLLFCCFLLSPFFIVLYEFIVRFSPTPKQLGFFYK